MCGISGFIGKNNEAALKAMTSSIAHRGPDDETFFSNKDAHFGFRRLSIIDLQGGRQPMFSENKDIAVILNGEIYNFKELRDSLIRLGHTFTTESDTEVIAHLYEERGPECFQSLNGMFAIAIWDAREEKLLLARDRLGKKPLYYCQTGETFLFASEPKAILKHPAVKRELNPEAIHLYLAYEFVPTPHTIYKNIYKLEPGSYLVFHKGKYVSEKFWDLSFPSNKPRLSEREYITGLDTLLKESVEQRSIADVPLGVYLSGGIDSSTIAWYASKINTRPLETFTISFEEASYDEAKHARKVANLLHANHHEERLHQKTALELLDSMVEIFDEPLADAAILPNMLLAKFSRQHITVALGGDGGDELFLGYQNIKAHALNSWYEKFPAFIKNRLAPAVVKLLPPRETYFSFPFKARRFLKRDFIIHNPFTQDLAWRGSFGPRERDSILLPFFKNFTRQPEEELMRHLAKTQANNFFDQLTYLYIHQYLMDDVLVKVDRASMAFGEEVRSPFLDYRVVQYAASLPLSMKFRRFKGKYILRRLMRGRLPDSIINRPKKGFGVPIASWLRGPLKPMAQKLFSPAYLITQNIFRPEPIQKLYAAHLSRQADYRKELWTLFTFQLWYERWMK